MPPPPPPQKIVIDRSAKISPSAPRFITLPSASVRPPVGRSVAHPMCCSAGRGLASRGRQAGRRLRRDVAYGFHEKVKAIPERVRREQAAAELLLLLLSIPSAVCQSRRGRRPFVGEWAWRRRRRRRSCGRRYSYSSEGKAAEEISPELVVYLDCGCCPSDLGELGSQ